MTNRNGPFLSVPFIFWAMFLLGKLRGGHGVLRSKIGGTAPLPSSQFLTSGSFDVNSPAAWYAKPWGRGSW